MSKLKKILPLFLFTLLTLTVLRSVLFIEYQGDFSSLNSLQVLLSFLMGVRVDTVVACWAFAVPALLYFLPLPLKWQKRLQPVAAVLLFIGITAVVMITAGDVLYYGHVHRHVANEMGLIGNDVGLMLETGLAYWPEFLLFVLFELVLLGVMKKCLGKPSASRFGAGQVAVFVLVMLAMVMGVRSKISGKPMGITDAFACSQSASGNLALNGVFTMVKTRKGPATLHFMDEKTAQTIARQSLASDTFVFDSDRYVLQRRLAGAPVLDKKYNVVIVLLESWSAKYVDSFSNNHFGVTPNFDRLAAQGLKFDNFYANGQRSIEGISATFTGIPALPYTNVLGHGLELSNRSYLGSQAKTAGYATLAMQSSPRNSFRVDSIARLAGFDAYYGAEDMPDLRREDNPLVGGFGTWDNNMFAFCLDKIGELKPPFLAFTFTASTHSPFVSPGKRWEKYPHKDESLPGFLNTLYYADDALGRFMDKAREQPWFDDTIFVFMADHALGYGNNADLDRIGVKAAPDRVLENMRIPLVIYAPKLFKPQVIHRLASQADLLPTLTHLLGWRHPFTSVSQSVFAKGSQPFVLFANGNLLGYITNRGMMKHNLKNVLESTLDKADQQAPLALYQTINTLQLNNTIAPPAAKN